MFKYKKILFYILSLLFVLTSLIELIIYITVDSNIFGLVYLLCNLLLLFLLIPSAYNYKRAYSLARISKLLLIVLFGLFNSFFLSKIVLNNINYTDCSREYINKIFIFKNILKPIIYFFLTIFAFFESKVKNKILQRIRKKVD